MADKGQKYSCSLKKVTIKLLLVVMDIFYVRGYAKKEESLIYLLLWTSKYDTPFSSLTEGQGSFTRRNCTFQNCFVTEKPSYFRDILDFDVIMFNILGMYKDMEIPTKRSEKQKYVLAAVESAAHKVPMKFNRFFNLTWTYRLDSDATFPYVVVKNARDEVIGPKMDMHWIDTKNMNETSLYVRNKLRKKRIAAAWFASNCEAGNGRLDFATELQQELAKYGQGVDVYGSCGEKWCPIYDIHDRDECNALVESTYYFYLAFENSFAEDYITEKILTGLEHFSVPVVYGSANYTRFMPDGIYINARNLGPARLATEMMDIIHDKKRYYDFFKWHGYYSFHFTGENDFYYEICGLCELLNNKTRMAQKTVYNTDIWWNEWYNGNPPGDGRLYLLLDDDKPKDSGLAGFVSNVYNYVFDS